MKLQILPKYVKLNGTALILEGNSYFRDAGAWSVDFITTNGKLFVNEISGPMSHAHNKELIECTEEEWKQDNKGYV